MPLIFFFITDEVVEDGRHICNVLEGQLKNRGTICPRIYTFGMGIRSVKNVRFHILFNDHTGSYVESHEEIMP